MDDEYALEIEKWELLVGRFMLAFGDIELISIRLWEKYYPEKNVPKHFADRVGKIIGKLKEYPLKNAEKIILLQEAIKLSKKRNTIAHNPTQVQVFEHTKTGELVTRHGMPSLFDDDYIDDLELEELAADARKIATDLFVKVGWDFSDMTAI